MAKPKTPAKPELSIEQILVSLGALDQTELFDLMDGVIREIRDRKKSG